MKKWFYIFKFDVMLIFFLNHIELKIQRSVLKLSAPVLLSKCVQE